jgi:hypothetical protein
MRGSGVYGFSKGKRGPVVAKVKGKTRITIRIDDDLLAWLVSPMLSAVLRLLRGFGGQEVVTLPADRACV